MANHRTTTTTPNTNTSPSTLPPRHPSLSLSQYYRNRHRLNLTTSDAQGKLHRQSCRLPSSSSRHPGRMSLLSLSLCLILFSLLPSSSFISAEPSTPPPPPPSQPRTLSLNFHANRHQRAAADSGHPLSPPSPAPPSSSDQVPQDQIVINQLDGGGSAQPRDASGAPLKGNPNYNYYVTSNNKEKEGAHVKPTRYQVAKFDFEHGKGGPL